MVVRQVQNQLPKSPKNQISGPIHSPKLSWQRWESLFDLLDFLQVAQSNLSGLQLL